MPLGSGTLQSSWMHSQDSISIQRRNVIFRAEHELMIDTGYHNLILQTQQSDY
jgi:hypothetical protein